MTTTQNTKNLAADGSLLISFVVATFPRFTSFGDEVDLPISGSAIAAMRAKVAA
jgi:hypothetical protein